MPITFGSLVFYTCTEKDKGRKKGYICGRKEIGKEGRRKEVKKEGRKRKGGRKGWGRKILRTKTRYFLFVS